jgi:RNA polymerase sigma-70 factor (ECF subfamily)
MAEVLPPEVENRWVRRALDGDAESLNRLLDVHRDRLRRIIAMRISPRLSARIDASDVLQDTYVEATRALPQYQANPGLPFFLWLRHLAHQRVIQLCRAHLLAQRRSVDREQSFNGFSDPTSESIAEQLIGRTSTPSHQAMRAEARQQLTQTLHRMEPTDREVLMLRHFERLSGPETAAVLCISHEAVKKRYRRALQRLAMAMQAYQSS